MHKLQQVLRCGEQQVRWSHQERCAVFGKKSLVCVQGTSPRQSNQNKLLKLVFCFEQRLDSRFYLPHRLAPEESNQVIIRRETNVGIAGGEAGLPSMREPKGRMTYSSKDRV